ncbi:MAG: endolytic transglycosylase MltG [bacterium]
MAESYSANRNLYQRIFAGIPAIIILVLILWFGFWQAPTDFPTSYTYTVKSGDTIISIANELKKQNIVRSNFWFRVFAFIQGNDLKSGDYYFFEKQSVWTVAKRVTTSDYQLITLKVTVPEGFTSSDIGKIVANKFFKITEKDFLDWSKRYEGYLFPDTYFWPINSTASRIVTAMKLNFDKQVVDIKKISDVKKLNWTDVINMASIVELETDNAADRRMVAGILWHRLKIGMPLQVNSTLKYIGVKDTYMLTTDKTKIDSPYNTYMYKGLPPTPVCNPGLDTITATVNPTQSSYLYFLTDRKGITHYAKSYAEHLTNTNLYLK